MDKFLKSVNKSQIKSKSKEILAKTKEYLEEEMTSIKNDNNDKNFDKLDLITKEIMQEKENFFQNDYYLTKLDKYFEVMKEYIYTVDSETKLATLFDKISSMYKYLTDLYDSLLNITEFEGFLNDLIDFFEKSFYLFILHFHAKFETLAFDIITTLLTSLDYQFHFEILQKLIELIKLLMAKRQLNLLICNRFIFNISLAINLTLHYSNEETRKFFLNSVVGTNEGLMTSYFICSATNNQFNFSKFYSLDVLTNFTDRLNKDLEKQINQFEILINDLNKQRTSSLNNRIKQVLNSISSIAKVIDSFLIRGNRTFIYSKILANLCKLIKNLWELLLIADIQEIDFSIESFQNLIVFYENIENLTFEKKLIIFAVISKLCEKNVKFVINMYTVIISLFSERNKVPQNSKKDIVLKIFSLIENHLARSKLEKYDHLILVYCKVILDIINKTNQEDIKEDFPQIKEFMESFDNVKVSETEKDNNFSSNLKDYLTLLNTGNSLTERNIKAKLTIEKLRDYKDSLKELFNLQALNLCIDNKIDNFLDNIGSEKGRFKESEIQGFLLECSIQLYKEVLQNTMK